MADVSDPAITAAYEEVRSGAPSSAAAPALNPADGLRADKTETNWLLLDYAGEKSDKLQLTGSGSGVRRASLGGEGWGYRANTATHRD